MYCSEGGDVGFQIKKFQIKLEKFIFDLYFIFRFIFNWRWRWSEGFQIETSKYNWKHLYFHLYFIFDLYLTEGGEESELRKSWEVDGWKKDWGDQTFKKLLKKLNIKIKKLKFEDGWKKDWGDHTFNFTFSHIFLFSLKKLQHFSKT